MLEAELEVINEKGIHNQPTSEITEAIGHIRRFSRVFISYVVEDGENNYSPFNILGKKKGERFKIRVNSADRNCDENKVLNEFVNYFKDYLIQVH